jgi:hypothetical protein
VVDELVCSTGRVILMGKPKYSEQHPPFTTFSNINSTWTDMGLNPGMCGNRPATNHLSYGTALIPCNMVEIISVLKQCTVSVL